VTPHYRIVLYNRTTDRFGGAFVIPARYLNQVLAIAGIATSANELGEYPLTQQQVRDISSLISFAADFSRFHYHLETVGPGHTRLWA